MQTRLDLLTRRGNGMNPRFLELLCCPECKGQFKLVPSTTAGSVIEECLRCNCGTSFTIRGGIPRILREKVPEHWSVGRFLRAQRKTQYSFGKQWRYFSEMNEAFSPDLFRYLGNVDEMFF